ncbi:hypothetical protein ASPZODRAFT_126933 [Penicilliopsis zonata CBS 506.65]|uniref:PH domain-containing protein n=1 Tax=Penicilliopsis zonata CBS 506.65 TaxID=1073090 RepID=A0A1L9SUY8_9EURO|nr:hypothetical protein ASPZODRAFT_126933 [Penicilliopsis zonata CBS 506.65]OJJ50956.1 hypothetical protein ASPZODRAFT_126933 [Penicilliopsis zonata CBS 506.65]
MSPSPPSAEGQTKSRPIPLDRALQQSSTFLRPPLASVPYRNGHLNLDTFSPVNENGSFEFDRVLKTGKVFRRVKSKHAFKAWWKPAYLVLRPNLLSVYKDEEATRLRASITLSEVTAVASVKSPRSRRKHVFGIFSPSKNYRFQASSETDAEDWMGKIRAETRVDEDEEAFLAAINKKREPTSQNSKHRHKHKHPIDDLSDYSDIDHAGPVSSPEMRRTLSPNARPRRIAYSQEPYSGNEITSYSDWSDGPSISAKIRSISSINDLSVAAEDDKLAPLPQDLGRSLDLGPRRDPERVVCQGYLQCLRLKGGVRQWNRFWVVARPKSLGFYKDDQEYSAVKIIPMSQVIDAAEIDPVSRSKKYCFQIITEGKSYRLCTSDEESLAKWLGSLKSIFVARKKAA